ncbi:pyrroline-5-carboxylate reductase [Croceibacterium mercuriale]|uniref:Pyrroline-5-carboxylate reductase n=1 Tax=Croceibacterium mercuriale TaxID=1572751 RepID=A0A0B2BZG4_9SPHN|nr:pyrroline-5-carboxylate reductase [Croceibacterium mercuriale]KHL25422.1 pyrroline-5-carboxylate reductase [Croceibacterium mercuriale]
MVSTVLLVGCGNMAGAMLRGWLAGGMEVDRFTVVDPRATGLPAGVRHLPELPAGEQFDAILLGIKPQGLDEAAPSIAPLAGPGTIVLSLLAGVELSSLRQRFADAGGLVRIMPNLAVALGKSPVALAADRLNDAEREAVFTLMQPLGTPEWFDEADFDLVTALAGSGPAFVYRYIDALAAAARELGMAPDKAARLAVAMAEGASALAASSPEDPGVLADRVASPGGVTRAGLDVLDEAGAINELALECLRAARDRSAAMAAEARTA